MGCLRPSGLYQRGKRKIAAPRRVTATKREGSPAHSPIQLVEFYDPIPGKAAELIRRAIVKGWQLKPGDAIHLATADHLKVSEFQTYDDKLDKFKELTDTHYPICRPIAKQPVMVMPEPPVVAKTEEPKAEEPKIVEAPKVTEAKAESKVASEISAEPKKESETTSTDSVQRSGSRPTESQAGTEGKT